MAKTLSLQIELSLLAARNFLLGKVILVVGLKLIRQLVEVVTDTTRNVAQELTRD